MPLVDGGRRRDLDGGRLQPSSQVVPAEAERRNSTTTRTIGSIERPPAALGMIDLERREIFLEIRH